MQVVAQPAGEQTAEYLGCVAPDPCYRGNDRLDVQDQLHGAFAPGVLASVFPDPGAPDDLSASLTGPGSGRLACATRIGHGTGKR